MQLRMNVFISSTSKDLKSYREHLRDYILRLGAFPVMMEEFNPSRDNALQVCYDYVQEADLFVGIYAKRYGHIADRELSYLAKDGVRRTGDGVTGITHWEYLWAKERHIPLYLFLLREKDDNDQPIAWPIEHIDKGRNKTHLLRFKKMLLKEHTVGFFSSKEDLASSVIATLKIPIFQWSPGSEPDTTYKATSSINDVNSGIDDLSSGKYEQAIRIFSQYIETNSHDPEGYFRRSQSYEALNDFERAVDDLSQAIKAQEQQGAVNEMWYARRGQLRKSLHRYDGALEDCDRAIRLLEARQHRLEYESRRAAQLGDTLALQRSREMRQSVNRILADLFDLKGTTNGDSGNLEAAIGDFTRAIQYYSNQPRIYMNLGKALMKAYADPALHQVLTRTQGREILYQSVAYFTEAIKRLPLDNDTETAEAYALRAVVRMNMNELEEALRDCISALRRERCQVEALICQGDIYRRQNKLDEAILTYGRAIDCNSQYYTAFMRRGETFMDEWRITRYASSLDSALDDFQLVIQLNPAYGYAYNHLGVASHAKGLHEKAVQTYRMGLETTMEARKRVVLHVNLGAALFELEHVRESLVEFNEAFRLTGSNEILALRAICHFALEASDAQQMWLEVEKKDTKFKTIEPLRRSFGECPRLLNKAQALVELAEKVRGPRTTEFDQ